MRCPSATGAFVTLTPREALTPVPYALALPGLRTQPNATSPNVLGGFNGNTVTTGVIGATIAGGGELGENQLVTDDYGTVGGGSENQAGDGAGNTSDICIPLWQAVTSTARRALLRRSAVARTTIPRTHTPPSRAATATLPARPRYDRRWRQQQGVGPIFHRCGWRCQHGKCTRLHGRRWSCITSPSTTPAPLAAGTPIPPAVRAARSRAVCRHIGRSQRHRRRWCQQTARGETPRGGWPDQRCDGSERNYRRWVGNSDEGRICHDLRRWPLLDQRLLDRQSRHRRLWHDRRWRQQPGRECGRLHHRHALRDRGRWSPQPRDRVE